MAVRCGVSAVGCRLSGTMLIKNAATIVLFLRHPTADTPTTNTREPTFDEKRKSKTHRQDPRRSLPHAADSAAARRSVHAPRRRRAFSANDGRAGQQSHA